MYKYTENNLFENPESYFYSKFEGVSFLKSFLLKRRDKLLELKNQLPNDFKLNTSKKVIISILKDKCKFENNNLTINTFNFLFKKLDDKKLDESDLILNKIIQKFEISKKINDSYSIKELKPIGNNKNIDIYILFGICLIHFYEQTNKLKYLNSILKLSDILCSIPKYNSFSFFSGSVFIIEKELNFIENILSKNNMKL